jgi:hypothetical protein
MASAHLALDNWLTESRGTRIGSDGTFNWSPGWSGPNLHNSSDHRIDIVAGGSHSLGHRSGTE